LALRHAAAGRGIDETLIPALLALAYPILAMTEA
jgi:hypothetical protein